MDIDENTPGLTTEPQALFERVRQNTFATFDGRHGRRGCLAVIGGPCDVWGTSTKVLAIDASEGEYAPGAICQRCAPATFSKAV
jgi:hypothetical protein